MQDITLEIKRDFYEFYERTDEKVYQHLLNNLDVRNASVYSCEGIDEIVSNYEQLSKDQYWPAFRGIDTYKQFLNSCSDSLVSYMRIQPDDYNDINKPMLLCQVTGVTFIETKNKFGIYELKFQDNRKQPFDAYVMNESIARIFEKQLVESNPKAPISYALLLQATPKNAVTYGLADNEAEHRFRLSFFTMEMGGEGDQNVEVHIDDPVLV